MALTMMINTIIGLFIFWFIFDMVNIDIF